MKISHNREQDEDLATHEKHVDLMKNYYSETASQYNSWHCDISNNSSHNFAVHELLNLMNSIGAKSILDVCCGTGRATKAMLDAGYSAKGIDLSEELIARGVDELKIPVDCLEVGDATRLPYDDNTFDVTCILGALHHTARPNNVIAEMIRVSRMGILISDEGNHLSGGIKSLLISLGIFNPLYRLIFRREPRQSRRMCDSDSDGPTFVFSVEEIIPAVRNEFPKLKTLTFYRAGKFQTCSFHYPRLFARQCIVIAHKVL
jgi:ubiquinone/menaquinone biosynthesis C-methylase UbiE